MNNRIPKHPNTDNPMTPDEVRKLATTMRASGDGLELFASVDRDERGERITFVGGRYGAHSLSINVTSEKRARIHWHGYCETNGIKLPPVKARALSTSQIVPDARVQFRSGGIVEWMAPWRRATCDRHAVLDRVPLRLPARQGPTAQHVAQVGRGCARQPALDGVAVPTAKACSGRPLCDGAGDTLYPHVNPMKHSIPKAGAPQHVAPPLPTDVARLLLAGLRSRKPERKRLANEACLAARAFAAGFSRGADPERACRRHVIGAHHEHWLRGYDAGQRAAEQAAAGYLRDQLLPLTTAADVNTAASSAPAPDAAAPTSQPERARATCATRAEPPPQLTLFSSEVRTCQTPPNSPSVASAPVAAAR
jgi:hypothetical protein